MYRLNVGPTLSTKMGSEAANSATEEQVWQAVHAVMTALEVQGPLLLGEWQGSAFYGPWVAGDKGGAVGACAGAG